MTKTYITVIDGKWYAFEGDADNNKVYAIGADEPKEAGCRYVASWNDRGIKYVASASPSRAAAYAKARRAGEYGGEV